MLQGSYQHVKSFVSNMLNSSFSFEGCDQNAAQQGYYVHPGFHDERTMKQAQSFPQEDIGGGDLWSCYDLCQGSSLQKEVPLVLNYAHSFPELVGIDDMQFNKASPPIQSFENTEVFETHLEKSLECEISELLSQKEKACPQAFSSLGLLKNYEPNQRRLTGEKLNESIDKESCPDDEGRGLSTEEIMRVAAAHYIELSAGGEDIAIILRHPLGLSFSGLTSEEIQNIELARLLLAAAEKISNQQYDRASNLLRQCYLLSSCTGNPVQRVVYHFSDALQERINRETGTLSLKNQRERIKPTQEFVNAILYGHPMQLVTFKKMALQQLMHFTSIQAILDNMASSKRIHLIDLTIKHGIHWTIMMQALSTRTACPVEYLKISAVGTSEEAINATGQRLMEFAESLCLPFYFEAVIVQDVTDLREGMFVLEEEEAIGVYSSMFMNSMIAKPDRLENVIRVIRKLKPSIMTVMDIESNHNSPSFIKRFTESLFFYSALFDCIDACMDRDDDNRLFVESQFFSGGIRNIVATESSERVVRQVGLSVWRSYFARFGLVEADLNEWLSYQASLLVEKFPQSKSWFLGKNGKSLTIGWRGTPLVLISAWKFQ